VTLPLLHVGWTEQERPSHKFVTATWLAVFHNEPVNEGSLTQLLSYLTAGLLWAFAAVVGYMLVVPV
jgi:hypothetical protein